MELFYLHESVLQKKNKITAMAHRNVACLLMMPLYESRMNWSILNAVPAALAFEFLIAFCECTHFFSRLSTGYATFCYWSIIVVVVFFFGLEKYSPVFALRNSIWMEIIVLFVLSSNGYWARRNPNENTCILLVNALKWDGIEYAIEY